MLDENTNKQFESFLEEVIGMSMENILIQDSDSIDAFIENRSGRKLKLGSDSRMIYRGSPALAEGRISTDDINVRFDSIFAI